MISSVLVSWRRRATRYAAPHVMCLKIQCFQEEDLEGTNPGEGQEEDEEELEDDGSLPSVDDLDGM